MQKLNNPQLPFAIVVYFMRHLEKQFGLQSMKWLKFTGTVYCRGWTAPGWVYISY